MSIKAAFKLLLQRSLQAAGGQSQKQAADGFLLRAFTVFHIGLGLDVATVGIKVSVSSDPLAIRSDQLSRQEVGIPRQSSQQLLDLFVCNVPHRAIKSIGLNLGR